MLKGSHLLTLNHSIIISSKSKCDLSCTLMSFSSNVFHRSSGLRRLPFFFHVLPIFQNVSQSWSQFCCWDTAFFTCWLQLAITSWGLVSCWRANKKQRPAWGLGSTYAVNEQEMQRCVPEVAPPQNKVPTFPCECQSLLSEAQLAPYTFTHRHHMFARKETWGNKGYCR